MYCKRHGAIDNLRFNGAVYIVLHDHAYSNGKSILSVSTVKNKFSYRCLREMRTHQFGDPGPHVPSDMGTGGPHITRDMGTRGPQHSGNMGILQ